MIENDHRSVPITAVVERWVMTRSQLFKNSEQMLGDLSTSTFWRAEKPSLLRFLHLCNDQFVPDLGYQSKPV